MVLAEDMIAGQPISTSRINNYILLLWDIIIGL